MANRITTLFKSNCPLLLQNYVGYSGRIIPKSQTVRSLYSQTTLGLDAFILQRDRTKNQLQTVGPRFREKMKEYTSEGSNNMVFTEDLKNMLHLAENDEDISVVTRMMAKFNQQNKQLRFGNYIFGPVIMRMFYLLNKPEEALQCFKATELDGIFDQLITYQILLDLLYENQKYENMLEVFELIKNKQIDGIKFAKNVIVLTYAALYKLNTKESLENALKLWSELQEIGHLPMRRATTFCAALAINQGQPGIALEILSTIKNANYTTVRNLKARAMSDLRRIDEVIPILKSILYEDSASMGPTQTFNKDVVEHIKHVIEKEGNEEMKLDFNRIEKHFVQQNHISDMTLDEQLCSEIVTPPKMNKSHNENYVQRQYINRNYQNNSRFRERTYAGTTHRPGLADLQ